STGSMPVPPPPPTPPAATPATTTPAPKHDTPTAFAALAPDTTPTGRSIHAMRPSTVDLELELDDVVEPPPPEPGEPTLSPESRAVIATCETELATGPDPLRAARLHYEIARAYETASGWLEDAAKHY